MSKDNEKFTPTVTITLEEYQGLVKAKESYFNLVENFGKEVAKKVEDRFAEEEEKFVKRDRGLQERQHNLERWDANLSKRENVLREESESFKDDTIKELAAIRDVVIDFRKNHPLLWRVFYKRLTREVLVFVKINEMRRNNNG